MCSILVYMKTTLNIPNSLFNEIKKITQKRGLSFRSIAETALRNYLKSQKDNTTHFKLKNGSFCGDGLCKDLVEGNWNEIRSRIYKGQGE